MGLALSLATAFLITQGMKLLPHWDNDQKESFIKTLAQPVKLVENTEHEAKTFAYGFAPFFLGLLAFVYVPIVWSAYLSFFEARNTVNPTRFVGLDNYAEALTDYNKAIELAPGLGLHRVFDAA